MYCFLQCGYFGKVSKYQTIFVIKYTYGRALLWHFSSAHVLTILLEMRRTEVPKIKALDHNFTQE